MATATFEFNINNRVPLGEKNQKTVRYYGTITFSAAADVYATGGLLPTTGFDLKHLGPYGDRVPLIVLIKSANASGFDYEWNQSTGKLEILSNAGSGTAAPTEITNGTALSATTPAISGDVINFEAVFPTGN